MTSTMAVGNANPAVLTTVEGFPSLSQEAAGLLKMVWRLSEIEDDWTKGGAIDSAWDRWTYWPYMAKVTYNLTFAIRMLGKIAQEIPAWREVCASAADKISARMNTYPSVYDWVEQKGLDPNRDKYPYFYYAHTMPPGTGGWYNAPGYAGNGLAVSMDGFFQAIMLAPVTPNPVHPYTHRHSPAVGREYDADPITAHGTSNIMFKGYYMDQLAVGLEISGDKARWEGPQHIVYDENLSWDYTAQQIADILDTQFQTPMDSGGSFMMHGLDCEVGKVFPLCVGVAGLGHRLWDAQHGTETQVGYQKWLEFAKTWVFGGNDSPEEPYTWGTVYYDRDLNVQTNLPQHDMPCFWTTVAYNTLPYETAWSEKILKDCIAQFGKWENGALRLCHSTHLSGPMTLDDQWGQAFAMATAYELGDMETYDALKAYVDRAWQPIHADGEFGYHFNLGEAWPRGIINHILGFSSAGGPGSTRRLYNEPNAKKFTQPTLSGVDYPNLTVRQAFYDEARKQLAIAIAPGQDASPMGSPTRLTISNLGGSDTRVAIDGVESDDFTRIDADTIVINTSVGEHTFLISLGAL
jgi:hypothetical protein